MKYTNNQNKIVSILLYGDKGNGKSSLGNQLLGYDAFKISDVIEGGKNL